MNFPFNSHRKSSISPRYWTWVVLLAVITPDALLRGSRAPQPQELVVTREFLNDGRISNRQCGQFIEYLCNLVPGMWAEKLYDGGFEGLSPYKFEFVRQTDFRERPWYPSGEVNRGNVFTGPTAARRRCDLPEDRAPPGTPCTVGISQDGISIEKGTGLVNWECFLARKGLRGRCRVRLHREAEDLRDVQLPAGAGVERSSTFDSDARSVR